MGSELHLWRRLLTSEGNLDALLEHVWLLESVQTGSRKSVPSLSCDLWGRRCAAEPGNWSELQQHLAEHLCDVFKNGFGDASMEQAQVRGGGLAEAGEAGSATGGGRRQRARCSSATGQGAGHSVVSQHGRAEGTDRHRLQNLSCPLRGALGRGNGNARLVVSRSSGRHQGQTRGGTRKGSRTARSTIRARVWVAFLRSLAATKGLAPEHVSTVKTYW